MNITDTQWAAWQQVQSNLTDRQKEVFEVIKSRPGGVTSKEVARALDVPLNTISGRFSELKADGIIFDTQERRERSAVYSLVPRSMNQRTLF